MGLATVDTFIGLAERAQIPFNFLDEPICRSVLFFPGMSADRTVHADLCQAAIHRRYFFPFFHCCSHHYHSRRRVSTKKYSASFCFEYPQPRLHFVLWQSTARLSAAPCAMAKAVTLRALANISDTSISSLRFLEREQRRKVIIPFVINGLQLTCLYIGAYCISCNHAFSLCDSFSKDLGGRIKSSFLIR